jgi:predicted DNA binding protein
MNGITIEKHLETWENKSLSHTLLILRFNSEVIGKYFTNNTLTILAGTNLTSKGLIVQFSGSSESIMAILNKLKQHLIVRSISGAKRGKGMISETISSEEYRVLKMAHSNGWYDSPRSTNLRKLAKLLNISKSSVSNHINSSESKIVNDFFGPS